MRTINVPSFQGEDWYVFVFTVQEFIGELKENEEGYLKWIPDAELGSLRSGQVIISSCPGSSKADISRRSLCTKGRKWWITK